MLKIHVLASGSAGNATIIENDDAALMVDCGINKKQLVERCAVVDFDLQKLAAIFITHEHNDHLSGLGVSLRHLAKNDVYPDIFIDSTTCDAAAERYLSDDKTTYRLHKFTVGDKLEPDAFPGLTIQSFATSHDVANPCGFAFSFKSNKYNNADKHEARKKIGLCTDTGILTDAACNALRDCDALLLEANHDAHMLKTGIYAPALKARVGGEHGHLSNEQFENALRELASPSLKAVCAMHLSHENNRPSLVEDILNGLFANAPIATYVASQSRPVSFSI